MPSSSDPKLPNLRNSKLNPLNIAHCTSFIRDLAYLNVPTPTNPSRKAGNKQGLKSKVPLNTSANDLGLPHARSIKLPILRNSKLNSQIESTDGSKKLSLKKIQRNDY